MVVVDILLKVASVGVWLATILSLVLPAGFVSKQHKQACHGLAASGTAPPAPVQRAATCLAPRPRPLFLLRAGVLHVAPNPDDHVVCPAHEPGARRVHQRVGTGEPRLQYGRAHQPLHRGMLAWQAQLALGSPSWRVRACLTRSPSDVVLLPAAA